MNRARLIVALLSLCLTGCFISPGELAQEDVLSIRQDTTASVAANGYSNLDFSLLLPGGSSAGKKITVTTTHGILSPAGTTAAAQKTMDLHTDGGDRLTFTLKAGREPGAGLLTAKIYNSTQVQKPFQLARSLPDQVALSPVPGSTFSSTITKLDITATLARRDGLGQVSSATRVHFLTCCTLNSTLGSCDARLLAPAFLEAATSTPGSVKASVSLNASGLAFVKQTGTSPADDFHATLYVLVLQPNKDVPGCDALSNVTKPGGHIDVAAGEALQLTLQRKAATTTTK